MTRTKNAERQRRWRLNNPEAAAQAARDSRARRAGTARRPVRVVVELTPGEAALMKEYLTADSKEYPEHATLEDMARSLLLGHALWWEEGGDEDVLPVVMPRWDTLLEACNSQCGCPTPDSLLPTQREEAPFLWRECEAAGKAARNVAGHDLSKEIKRPHP